MMPTHVFSPSSIVLPRFDLRQPTRKIPIKAIRDETILDNRVSKDIKESSSLDKPFELFLERDMERRGPATDVAAPPFPANGIMQVDRPVRPTKKRVGHDEIDDNSAPRKKAKTSPVDDTLDVEREQMKDLVATRTVHPPPRERTRLDTPSMATPPHVVQQKNCPTWGHAHTPSSESKEKSDIAIATIKEPTYEEISLLRNVHPLASRTGRGSARPQRTRRSSSPKPSKSKETRPSNGSLKFKGLSEIAERVRENRVPPRLLASFASTVSIDSSMEDAWSSVDETKTKPVVKTATSRKVPRLRWKVVLCTLLTMAGLCWIHQTTRTPTHYSDDCIAAQGGGYSGFYYMHGVLERNRASVLPDPSSPRDFVCYSAGCLSVVALWSNYTSENVVDFGQESQRRVTSGQMPWIKATERMVHNLIRGNGLNGNVVGNATSGESPMQVLARTNPRFLASLNIITTSFSTLGWPIVSVRTPTNLGELEEILTQTCWLPFATGDGLIHRGHLDGAFLVPFHPTCPTSVGISNDWRIYFNMVNVMMGAELPRGFFRDGSRVQLPM